MEQYLIVGGMLFWIFAAIASVIIVAAVANESLPASLIFTVIAVAVLVFAFKAPVLDYMPGTWWGWLLAALGYLGAGAIWSLYKFRIEFKARLQRYAGDWGATWKPHSDGSGPRTWDEKLERDGPQVGEMKEEIMTWIAYWPISLAIYLFSDLFRHVVETVYQWVSGIYEGIAKRLRESIKK